MLCTVSLLCDGWYHCMFVHENKLFWMLKELTCILNIIIVKSNVFLPEQFFNTDRLTLDVKIFKLC